MHHVLACTTGPARLDKDYDICRSDRDRIESNRFPYMIVDELLIWCSDGDETADFDDEGWGSIVAPR